jgi:hypothetical protein
MVAAADKYRPGEIPQPIPHPTRLSVEVDGRARKHVEQIARKTANIIVKGMRADPLEPEGTVMKISDVQQAHS